MPDWWRDFGVAESHAPQVVFARLLLAVVAGIAVALVYRLARRERRDRALSVTLVLLTALVAVTTLVIADNVARAFSLVGALSIVRFRTVVEDTRDTAFVIFAVVVGMACGSGHYEVGLLGLVIVGGAAGLLRDFDRARGGAGEDSGPEKRVEVRLGAGRGGEDAVAAVLDRLGVGRRLLSAATARAGAAVDVRYAVRLRDPSAPLALLRELQALDGVQHVELADL
ncbi:MAG TPA: DUF4956 domain-containing protein [Planctomycetota bacterium]|nr:DUF4956 domain-containing protein [Planctomycetota bacterium]